MTDEATHLAECNQGEWKHLCKFGDDDCPAMWDPWETCKIPLGGYNSSVDDDAIAVLVAIRDGVKRGREGGKYGNYVTDIAKKTGLSESHVELYQYIFCSAGWCDYGTSPRGCFPDHKIDFDALIGKWETYYRLEWGEEPGETPVAAQPCEPRPPFGIFDFAKQAELAADDFAITRMDNSDHLPLDFDGPIVGSICSRQGDIWIAANAYCEYGVISLTAKQAILAAGYGWQPVGAEGERVLVRRRAEDRPS